MNLATNGAVLYGRGLQPPYGEPEVQVRCIANGTEGPWLDRYNWSPGNHTRYDLVYGRREYSSTYEPTGNGEEYLLVHVQTGRAMVFGDNYLHHSYLEEKLGVNEADAAGILGFLKRMGHAVGYPHPVAVPDDLFQQLAQDLAPEPDITPSTGGHTS